MEENGMSLTSSFSSTSTSSTRSSRESYCNDSVRTPKSTNKVIHLTKKMKKRAVYGSHSGSPSSAVLSSTIEIGKQLQDLRHLALSCCQDKDPHVPTTSAHIELQLHPFPSEPRVKPSSMSPERSSFERLKARLSECETTLQQHLWRGETDSGTPVRARTSAGATSPAMPSAKATSLVTPPDVQQRLRQGQSPSDDNKRKNICHQRPQAMVSKEM